MEKYTFSISIIALFILIISAPLSMADVEIREFNMSEQLSHRQVHSICQDSRGFLWIGTQFGINRYDGEQLKLYINNKGTNKAAISDDYVTVVFVDSHDSLWVGTWSNGLNLYLPEVDGFKVFKNDPSDPNSLSNNLIRSIFEDKAGNVWVGTAQGLNLFDRKDHTFSRSHHQEKDDDKFIVTSMAQSTSDHIWIGTRLQGLQLFDTEQMKFDNLQKNEQNVLAALNGKSINVLRTDNSGHLWIGTRNEGLYRCDTGQGTIRNWQHDPSQNEQLSSNFITEILVDEKDNVWIGTDKGLYTMKAAGSSLTCRYFESATNNKTKHRFIDSIYQDDGGIVWIGTDFGLYYADNNQGRFTTYTYPSAVLQESDVSMVYALYADDDSTVLTGSLSGGFSALDHKTEKIVPVSSNHIINKQFEGMSVRQIQKDYQGNYWIGTMNGLFKYDPVKDNIEQIDSLGERSGKAIRLLKWDDKNHLWIGTLEVGLFRLNIHSQELTPFEPIHSKMIKDVVTIYDIQRDSDNTLWISNYYYLLNYDEKSGKLKVYDRNPLDPTNINHFESLIIHKSKDGQIWIGSTNTLNKYQRESDSFKPYKLRRDQEWQRIYSIQEDALGRLWIANHNGLTVFDPKTEKIKNFTTKDGIAFREFNILAHCQTQNGIMYFGGTKGVISFNPLDFKINEHVPKLSLTEFRIYEEEVNLGSNPLYMDEFFIDYNDKFVSFQFAVLDFSDPELNQLSYKLEGYNDSWINTGTKRSISFTNLPGGKYTLRVIGSNNDEIWNEEGISLRLVVKPPYWATIWFQALILLLTGTVVAAVFVIRNIATKRRNKQLEELNTELNSKVSEISSLNNELKAFDYSVSNALRTPLRHIHSFSELLLLNKNNLPSKDDERYLGKIVNSVENLWKMIDSLMTLSKVKNASLDIVEVDLSRIARVVANDMEKKYCHNNRKFVIVDSVLISGDIILLKIALECLFDNACKYSRENKQSIIEFGMANHNGTATLFIKDNGTGFNCRRKEKLFVPFHSFHTDDDFEGSGLSLPIVERIITRHGGKIWAESDGESGATFYFTLPQVNDE